MVKFEKRRDLTDSFYNLVQVIRCFIPGPEVETGNYSTITISREMLAEINLRIKKVEDQLDGV